MFKLNPENKQKNIKNVDNIIKNTERPSTPKKHKPPKLVLNCGLNNKGSNANKKSKEYKKVNNENVIANFWWINTGDILKLLD